MLTLVKASATHLRLASTTRSVGKSIWIIARDSVSPSAACVKNLGHSGSGRSESVWAKTAVAAATRLKVERAVRELGYRPDHLVRSLRTQRSAIVALVIPDITNPFYPVLARGLEDSLSAAGYRMFICNTDAKPEQEREFLADLAGRRVEGIVISRAS
jgi:LacI family transcriptional regulator